MSELLNLIVAIEEAVDAGKSEAPAKVKHAAQLAAELEEVGHDLALSIALTPNQIRAVVAVTQWSMVAHIAPAAPYEVCSDLQTIVRVLKSL